MPDEVPKPASGSFPGSERSPSEEADILAKARIARFSQSVLTAETWFRTANELTAAMELLEPHIEHFWECLRAQVLDNKSEAEPEHCLINVHMMLAGFAIENLCKGYLVDHLSPEEREGVKSGVLPDSLRNHRILDLTEQTRMTLSNTEKDLVNRINEAVFWRGRYPSATSHKGIRPFAQIGSDLDRIKTVLQKLRRHVGAKDSYRIK